MKANRGIDRDVQIYEGCTMSSQNDMVENNRYDIFVYTESLGRRSQSEDDSLRTLMNIMRMSQDPRVRHYLRVLLLEKNTRLRFRIAGNVAIRRERLELPNGIVLEPHPIQSLNGMKIDEITTEQWDQLTRQEYIIDAYVDVDPDYTQDMTPQVTNLVENIDRTVGLLSFHMREKLRWLAAILASNGKGNLVALPAPLSPATSTHPEEKHLQSFVHLIQRLGNLPERNQVDIYRAIDWFQQGVNSPSVLNQFLSFWLAIETLARSLYPKYKDKSGKTQIKTAFQEYLDESEVADEALRKCFQPNDSWERIRNDIAHGLISEADIDHKNRVQTHLFEIEKMAKRLILNTIDRLASA